MKHSNRLFLVALIFVSPAIGYAQGGGGEKTTSATKEPVKNESGKAPPKINPSAPSTTEPKFRFDGAYRLLLPEGKGVLWLRFLRAGDVLFIKSKDTDIKAPQNCLVQMSTDERGQSTPDCSWMGGAWGRSNAPPKFLDANTFEFVFISSGTFTGRFRGNILFLKHYGSDLDFALFPSSPFMFFKMTFNEGSPPKPIAR
jgi:hypothetical protein